MKLVIIAAGRGSRLKSETKNNPKALTVINGYTIIDIILNNCVLNKINEIVIITGYDKTSIRSYLYGKWNNLNIDYIYNDEWNLENGISVLKAKSSIGENDEFMVSMSDHLYFADMMKKVKESSLSNRVVNVGLDFNINDIFDIDDGMKVFAQPDTMMVKSMSKNLKDYNAIDVGLFKCSYKFFSFLENLNKSGSCSLSAGCNELIDQELLGGVDIRESFWLDIDTPEALHFARNNNHVLNLINSKE
ncbi:MAG: sugar phosphate nucleotidyltransferase [Candidatus Neomarinimicrobiota bacterium]